MPNVLVRGGPTLVEERYEAAVMKFTGCVRSLGAHADWPVEGLLVNASGQGNGGFRGTTC